VQQKSSTPTMSMWKEVRIRKKERKKERKKNIKLNYGTFSVSCGIYISHLVGWHVKSGIEFGIKYNKFRINIFYLLIVANKLVIENLKL
jgi:hypothetical protein